MVRISTRKLGNHQLWRRLIAIAVPILLFSSFSLVDFTVGEDIGPDASLRKVRSSSSPNAPIVDIISVGSVLREANQDALLQTFGRNPAVRNFFRITEQSDNDRECSVALTTDQIENIISFCSKTQGISPTSTMYRTNLFKPKKEVGWLCAQKRPIDGLNSVLQQYKKEMNIPDYLLIIDDDTFMNVGAVSRVLRLNFTAEVPHMVAGCLFDFLDSRKRITFPYGGFGTFLTKASIERLLRPIHCRRATKTRTAADRFVHLACLRINRDVMGEKLFFRDGMSVVDLMFAFAAGQPFSDVSNWQAGFCWHSDHMIAYFCQFYHISVPDEILLTYKESKWEDVRLDYKFTSLTNEKEIGGRRGECHKVRENCTASSTVCHYIQPAEMVDLHRQILREV